jgi:hypothetical protein
MIRAVTSFPHMVYGTNGFCTDLMASFPNRSVIGKRGASGVYISGIVGSGIGCAVKMDDGSMECISSVTVNFLRWAFSHTSARCCCCTTAAGDASQAGAGGSDYSSNCCCSNIDKLSSYERRAILNCVGIQVGCLSCVDNLFV